MTYDYPTVLYIFGTVVVNYYTQFHKTSNASLNIILNTQPHIPHRNILDNIRTKFRKFLNCFPAPFFRSMIVYTNLPRK